MKIINLFFVVLILSACTSPQTAEVLESSAVSPTQTLAMANVTPTNTVAPTSTITPIPLTATPMALYFNYEIDLNAPSEDVEIIKKGFAYVHTYITEVFGEAIPVEIQPSIRIKIVASGKGNPDPGAGGACCTALDKNGSQIFIDVLHPEWIVNVHQPTMMWLAEKNALIIPAHEYVHAWQFSLGCLRINHQPLGDWMNEGIAHYLAHQMIIKNGILKQNIIEKSMIQGASFTGEINVPLKDLFASGSKIWPGHIGYFAVKNLVENSSTGVLSLKNLCEDVASGVDFEQAFKQNFGLELEDFYTKFETFRTNSGMAVQGRITGDLGLLKYDELLIVFCNHELGFCLDTATVNQDGSFKVVDLAMGLHSIEIKNIKNGETIGWYTEDGISQKACATKITLPRISFNELIIDLQQKECP
ncbi:MAG TPA: hypothetical protein PLX90_03460 [Anaerolineales bacterium]|nr:hypothetical protein [Anaerolineales bacterium]